MAKDQEDFFLGKREVAEACQRLGDYRYGKLGKKAQLAYEISGGRERDMATILDALLLYLGKKGADDGTK